MKNYFFRCTAIFILILSLGVSHSWAWDLADGRKVYFDMQNCTDFGTPYFRIGRDSWSAATAMTLVPGTKYLYLYTQSGKWENYGAFSVADGKGFTEGKTIYQPWSGQPGSDGYTTRDVIISKQLLFQKYDVTSDCYLQIKSANGDPSNGCQYYNVNAQTADNGGSLVTLPTYSVTYSTPTNGTLTVTRYNGSTYDATTSGDSDYKPTQIIKITTTPNSHFVLDELVVDGATQIDGGDTYYVTDNCTIEATFAPQWSINGTMSTPAWDIYNGLEFVSEHTYRGTITLDAHTAYNFKVLDRATTTWYGCGTRDNDYTYVGQTDAVAINSTGNDGHNVMLMTTKAGEYTFEWNDDQKKLMITFPTTIKHPSMDYIYMEKYSDWNGGSYSYIHNWYTGTPNVALTDGGIDPKMTASFTSKSPAKTFYTYPVLTKYPHFKIAQGLNGGDGGVYHATSNMEVTDDHKGHYVYHNGSAWVWATFQVYIKLENQGADEGKKGTLGVPVAFNDTALSARISKPVKTNYDFGGYYTAAEGGGVQIIDENGDWQTNVSDYTEDGAWIHAGDTTTLYAKWTETPRTITLQVSPEGAGSFDVGGVAKEAGSTITAYISTPTAIIRADSIHPAWKFKGWVYSTGVGPKTGTDIYNTVQINADRNGTLTAEFEPRFTLVGATEADREVPGGMPGWSDYTKEFTVNSIDPVNLTYVCTLNAYTWYQCAIHDRVKGDLGDGTDGMFLITKDNHPHCTNKDKHMRFQTVGAGKYVFKIDEFDGDGYPYIKLLWPWQVNFGWKYANADAMSTLNEGGGGTLAVTATEGGENHSVAIGDYIMHGGHISFEATPYDDYNFAGWWTSDSYAGNPQWGSGSSTVGWDVTEQDAKLYAKFVEKTDTLKAGTTWSGGTWSTGSQPTADIVAVIKSPVEVDITTAKAKKVLIMQNSPNTGQLEIPAGKELVVRTTIKKTTDGSTYGATGENDIIIGSTLAEGNGALVMGAHDGTNKATVYFATKAKTTGEGENKHNVNQFIGTPFNDENDILYDYYGTKIYEFKAAHDGDKGTYNEWQRVASTGQKMNGFFGYNILTNQTSSPVLEMTGTLCRTTHTETISGYHKAEWDSTENMFANSWVAPIYIPNFKDTCFVNIEKTIYIFNAGTVKDQEGHAMNEGTISTTAAGQYCVLPVKSSPWVGLTVIPSMQAFSVFATGANPKLKFDYQELVYNPSNGTATIVPTRAPRRTATNDPDAPTVLKLKASGESGYAANIVMLNRADFSEGFDDGWDGRFLPGDDAAPQLYAVTADGNMAINCSPDIEGTLLGFKAGEADNLFTFTFEYDDEALYLYDTQTQLYTRVQTGNSYTFSTADGDAHNRFILTRNAPSIATGMDATPETSPGANKVIIDTHLYIFRAGMLYDATGRIIK